MRSDKTALLRQRPADHREGGGLGRGGVRSPPRREQPHERFRHQHERRTRRVHQLVAERVFDGGDDQGDVGEVGGCRPREVRDREDRRTALLGCRRACGSLWAASRRVRSVGAVPVDDVAGSGDGCRIPRRRSRRRAHIRSVRDAGADPCDRRGPLGADLRQSGAADHRFSGCVRRGDSGGMGCGSGSPAVERRAGMRGYAGVAAHTAHPAGRGTLISIGGFLIRLAPAAW